MNIKLNDVCQYILDNPDSRWAIKQCLDKCEKEKNEYNAIEKAKEIARELNDLSIFIEKYCSEDFKVAFYCTDYCTDCEFAIGKDSKFILVCRE